MSVSGRGGVFVGTIWADARVEGQAQTQQQLQNLNRTAGEATKGFADLTQQVYSLALQYGLAREALSGWKEMIAEDKAMRGATAMMKQFGGYTEQAANRIKDVSDHWELFGKQNEDTLQAFKQLYSVLKITGAATDALNTAVKVSLVTQTPLSSVVDAIAKSYGGQDMQIRRLLGAWDEGAKSAKGFAEFMAIAGRVGRTYAEQMSPAEQAQLRFNKAFKDFKVEGAMAAQSPAIKIFDLLTERAKLFNIIIDDSASLLQRFWAAYAVASPLFQFMKPWALLQAAGPTPDIGNVSWSMVPRGFTGPLAPGQVYEPPPGPGKEGKAGVDWDAYNKWVEEQTQFGKDAEKRYSQIDEQGLRDRDARLKRMQDSWDAAHQQMFNTAEMFSNGVGNMFGDMVANGEFSFERLADYWKSMLAQMLSDLIASRIMDWLGTSITAGKWGGGARPGKGTEYGGQVNAGSFGGFRPRPLPSMPSGSNGVTVIIPAMSLLDAFNGSSVKVQNGVAVRIVTKGINSVAALS